jgi:hypothetical protein
MQTAPKDRPILVWHDHDSDPYYGEDESHLTVYGAHCEGMTTRPGKGYCVAVYGGGVDQDESGEGWGPWTYIPDWWFDAYSEFEIPLAPLGWAELTEPELPFVKDS